MKTWAYLKGTLLILMQGLSNLRARCLKLQKKEEDHAAEIRERKHEEEMGFEKEKLEQRLKYEKQIRDRRKDQKKKDKSINAKLLRSFYLNFIVFINCHFVGLPYLPWIGCKAPGSFASSVPGRQLPPDAIANFTL